MLGAASSSGAFGSNIKLAEQLPRLSPFPHDDDPTTPSAPSANVEVSGTVATRNPNKLSFSGTESMYVEQSRQLKDASPLRIYATACRRRSQQEFSGRQGGL